MRFLSTPLFAAMCAVSLGALSDRCMAEETRAAGAQVSELQKALDEAASASSEARQRLAVKRVIRDAQDLLEKQTGSPDRFTTLGFLFQAHQKLIVLDDDAANRKKLLEIAAELAQAPDEFAALRFEADLLLTQAQLAREGATAEVRAKALRPFIARYLNTPAAAQVLRVAIVMALELGDNNLVNELQTTIEEQCANDLEMITFLRDKLGGQVIGAPFIGTFQRSDGKQVRFPMDGLGRSTMLVFWSKDDAGLNLMKGLAEAAIEKKEDLAGRLEIVSINLDELPDAGESIIRGLGVDWQVLHLPGGMKNPIYQAYARVSPRILTVNPTGYTALVMADTTRQKSDNEGKPDYGRMFQSTLARNWTEQRYVSQITSLMVGDHLILDPAGGIDPGRPPELKALPKSEPLPRSANCVPEDTLKAIQQCFVPPPLRYRLSHAEIRQQYASAEELCRKTIAEHPTAPDLWIVRNRLITALLGLWKTDANLSYLEKAIAEAKSAITAGYPAGCDIIAQLCVAREKLRDPSLDPEAVIQQLVADHGGDDAPASLLAGAAMLSFDVAERKIFEKYRDILLSRHTEEPMMWTFTSFLVDRYHQYWIFQMPFTAGWSFGRRQDYYMTTGDSEPTNRTLDAEFLTHDGKSFSIPDQLDSEWTAIVFAQPGPWQKKRDDGLPPSPERLLLSLSQFAASRPDGEIKVYIALWDQTTEPVKTNVSGIETTYPTLIVPDGIKNPLVHRLGILSEDTQLNSVLIRGKGRIAGVLSGLSQQTGRNGTVFANIIQQAHEDEITKLLDEGKIDSAKEKIFALAPIEPPVVLDKRGKPIKQAPLCTQYLRARARVLMALKQWDQALADIEEVVSRQLGSSGGMSLRTKELDLSEALRDQILRDMKGAAE